MPKRQRITLIQKSIPKPSVNPKIAISTLGFGFRNSKKSRMYVVFRCGIQDTDEARVGPHPSELGDWLLEKLTLTNGDRRDEKGEEKSKDLSERVVAHDESGWESVELSWSWIEKVAENREWP
jgi:hypothetical protein